MMPVGEILKGLQKTAVDNSPAILSALGAVGTLSTAVLSAKAAIDAYEDILLEDDRRADDQVGPMNNKERLKLTWVHFIPPLVVGSITVGCIIGANTISSRRSTALVTAYTITDKAFNEYKEKVVEQIGPNKEQKVRDAIVQDRMDKEPVSTREVIITGNGDVLCYETLSGRYFQSNMETIRKAQNDVNEEIFQEMAVSLNEFWNRIGLANTQYGEQVGWNTDKMLDVQFTTMMSDDGRPCLSVGYSKLPFPGFTHSF